MASESTPFAGVPWPIRPSPGINYNFVSLMYLAGSALALLFLALETQVLAPLIVESEVGGDAPGSNASVGAGEGEGAAEESPWKEFAKGMEGMHLIFLPFLPCLLWSLAVRHFWLREVASREKKDN
ncbi:hypothetical protein ACHAXT_010390 [Thalassiosira profunda]